MVGNPEMSVEFRALERHLLGSTSALFERNQRCCRKVTPHISRATILNTVGAFIHPPLTFDTPDRTPRTVRFPY